MKPSFLIWVSYMSRRSKKKGAKGLDRINVRADHEVMYWSKELGIDQKTLTSAVKAVGESADKVRDYVLGRARPRITLPRSRRESSG